jgi:hypothetical protein
MNKKRVSKAASHATMSFDQMVANAVSARMRADVAEQAAINVQELGNQMAKKFFQNLGNIQTRLMALERLLIATTNIDEKVVQDTVMDIEDEATGYEMVSRSAQLGDLLRVTVQTKPTGQEAFGPVVRKEIGSLGSAPYSLTKTIEEGLVGVFAGETREIDLEGKVLVRVTVDRVSVAAKVEGTNENSNA